ncbi:DUF1080 domain-containing protein [Candidatus Poribacteria bacterium]|nr:DUF1080 domain-containing protein [Candidatus Poribacteria bacterium]MYA99961.1 DUF1080 domain-containing protein [Candidatus Poribacteria bacterium]
MKSVIIGLCILLFIFAAQAGTFLDTFDDGELVKWEELVMFGINVPGSWEIIDGQLQGSNHGVTRLLTIGEETWQDYDIEFDVKPLEKHGPGTIVIAARIKGTWGVVCGIDDSAGPAAECFGGNLRGNFFLTYAQKPHAVLKLRKWATFQLSVRGKHLTFRINGKQVLDPIALEPLHGFPEFPTGRIGLGLANYTTRFDNLKITGPDIPNKGGLSVTPRKKLAMTWANLKQF